MINSLKNIEDGDYLRCTKTIKSDPLLIKGRIYKIIYKSELTVQFYNGDVASIGDRLRYFNKFEGKLIKYLYK